MKEAATCWHDTVSEILVLYNIELEDLYMWAADSPHCMVSKKRVMHDYVWKEEYPDYLIMFMKDNPYFLVA